jgi:hypothetical protein
VSDNPYQSPTEVATAGLSVEKLGQVGQQRLGGLICTVLILDCIPCLGRFSGGIYHVVNTGLRLHDVNFIVNLCLLFGIAASGLSGNVLILLKKKAGVLLAVIGFALSVTAAGFALLRFSRSVSPQEPAISEHTILVFIVAFWACWLIVYGIVVWMAAKKLGWIRRNVSTA